MDKKILMIAHDNTHSTSRIFRNVELIKRAIENLDNETGDEVRKRLEAIEKSAIECRSQVDELYSHIKNNSL